MTLLHRLAIGRITSLSIAEGREVKERKRHCSKKYKRHFGGLSKTCKLGVN